MDDLNDDFVATLLTREATDRNSRYSAGGLQALLPQRVAEKSLPKPNTRFLRNIVREADSHNAALRAKEAADSKLRLRQLSCNRTVTGPTDGDLRAFRGRKDPSEDDFRRRRRSKSSSPAANPRGAHTRRHEQLTEGRQRNSPTYKRKKRPRSVERHSHDKRFEHNSSGRRHYRTKEPTQTSRDRAPERLERGEKQRRREGRSFSREREVQESGHYASEIPRRKRMRRGSSSSSDPLDELIGPAPPPAPRARGRGTASSSGWSQMDVHFSESYNPSTDVRPDSDEEHDWDNALEALRDRQKWRQQGAERLRSAGFDDEFISAWENNSTKDEAKLKWSQKGATREWDRGKCIEEETGEISWKAQWAK